MRCTTRIDSIPQLHRNARRNIRRDRIPLKPLAAAIGAALALFSGAGQAADCTFGATTGNWDNAGNWSCNQVPDTGDTTTVGSGRAVTIDAAQGTSGLTNSGSVNIDSNSLLLQGGLSGSSNTGTVNVGGPSTAELVIRHGLDNTGGVINIGDGSVLRQQQTTLTGGTVNTTGSGAIVPFSIGNVLDGVTLNGNLDVNKGREEIHNGLTLNGTTRLGASVGGNGLLVFQGGDQTLSGTGTVVLMGMSSQNNPSQIVLTGGTTTTIGSGITIQGQDDAVIGGQTGSGNAILVNNGVISADTAGETFHVVTFGGTVNNNTLEARNGGTLRLRYDVTNNGQINALDGSTVSHLGTITGGTINTAGTGRLTADDNNNSVLDGVTLNGRLDLTPNQSGRERIVNGLTLGNGTIEINSNNVLDLSGVQTIGGTGAIVLGDASTSNRILLANGSVTTIGSGVTIRGENGSIIPASTSPTTPVLINNGLISADVSGGTVILGGHETINNSVMDARNGGTLRLQGPVTNGAGAQINAENGSTVVLAGSPITGGTLNTTGTGRIFADRVSNFGINTPNILDGVTLNGQLDVLFASARNGLTLANNSTVEIVSNGGFQSIGTQTIGGTGSIVLGGTSLSSGIYLQTDSNTTIGSDITVRGNTGTIGLTQARVGADPNLTNNGVITADVAGGTIRIAPNGTLTNNGLIHADLGTIRVDQDLQGGGTLQIGANGQMNLADRGTSLGTGNYATGNLIHNGNNAGSLALGSGLPASTGNGDVVVSNDYNNANFGVGNAFDPRANVTGPGVINAIAGTSQAVSGAGISNGATATPTLALGNVHVGVATTQTFTVDNSGNGAILRGAIQTAGGGAGISDPRLSVTPHNFGPLAPGSSSTPISVTFTASTAGAISATGTNVIGVVNNFDNVANQLISIGTAPGAAAYRLADTNQQPAVIDFGNVLIGSMQSQFLNIQNTAIADGFSESLDSRFAAGGTTGDATNNGGSISLLAAGAANNSSMAVGIDTSAIGARSGQVIVAYDSNGAGTSALGITGLPSQTIGVAAQVQGMVGTLAMPSNATPNPVDFGAVRVGALAVGPIALSIGNDAQIGEGLNASIGGASSGFAANGAFNNLAPGATNSTDLQVTFTGTGMAGRQNGTATISLESDGTFNNGNTTALAPQTVNMTAAVYQVAQPNPAALPTTVNLGNFRAGVGAQGTSIAITNTSVAPAGFQEGLNAQIAGTSGNATAGGFTNTVAGNSGILLVGLSGIAAGVNSGSVQVQYQSNGVGTSGLATLNLGGPQTVNVTGTGYRLADKNAQPAVINFGNVLIGSSQSQFLNIANTAIGDGFSERLDSHFAGTTGNATTNGGRISLLAAGGANNTSMAVGIDTSGIGARSGTVTVAYDSNGAGTSGLGITGLPNQTVGVAAVVQGMVGTLAQPSQATPNPVDFGAVRINAAPVGPVALSISNNAVIGEGLNASIGGATTGFAANGAFNNLAPGATNNASLLVSFTGTGTAGLRTGTATIALESNGTFNSGTTTTLASQTVNMTAEVYRLANPTNVTPSVTLAARVGDAAPTGTVSITNGSPDIYTEALRVTTGATPAGFSAGANPADIAAQGVGTIQVSLNTSTAGAVSGNLMLNNVSTGAGTTGAADIGVGSNLVALAGRVYTAAVAQVNTTLVDFGIVHRGDVVANQNVSVTNGAAVTALNDVLVGGLSAPGPFTSSDTLGAGLGAGQSGLLGVGLDTTASGIFSAQAIANLASRNPDLADLALNAPNVMLQAQVNEYANVALRFNSGSGSFSRSGNVFTLDFGNLIFGTGSYMANLGAFNDVFGIADFLAGSFTALDPLDFMTAGFTAFGGLGAQQGYDGLFASLDASALGMFQDSFAVTSFGSNASGFNQQLADLTLVIRANVVQGSGNPVPEPGTLLLVLLGGSLVLLQLRRRAGVRR